MYGVSCYIRPTVCATVTRFHMHACKIKRLKSVVHTSWCNGEVYLLASLVPRPSTAAADGLHSGDVIHPQLRLRVWVRDYLLACRTMYELVLKFLGNML